MMTFVNMDSDGLVILPTHRVVHSLEDFDAGSVPKRSGRDFSQPRCSRALKPRMSSAR